MTALPKVLLVHDGELSDVEGVLAQLGASFQERHGQPTAEDHGTRWDLIVGSPRRVLELQVGAAGEKPTRIALIDGDSKTLIAMLRRSGVDVMVQRPVHPAALRLLILHSLYQGPEKRRHQRITVGAPVRFRAGLLRRPATLADLSLRGCRLLSQTKVKRDQRIRIFLGSEIGASKAFGMAGRVVRSGPTEGAGAGMQAIAISFDVVTRDEANLLKQILRAYVSGPHVLEREAGGAKQAVARAAGTLARQDAAEMQAGESGGDLASQAAESESGSSDSDRREERRYAIDRHIIALGVEATRVLIGRDISVGGMRVESNDTLCVGDELRLALHVRARSEPLVVSARVDRDDSEDGIGLRFFDLTETAETYLRKMVNFLPILAARGGDEGCGVIVSEILERVDGPGPMARTAGAVVHDSV